MCLIIGSLFSSSAFAADPVVAPEKLRAVALAKAATPTASKWSTKLTLGGTGSANSSSHVVGAVDGTTMQLGLLLVGEANHVSGRNEWKNAMKLQHAQTRTPLMDAWVKSADNLEMQSTYLIRMKSIPWVGPFARAKLQTQVLGSYDIRPGESTIKYQDAAGKETASETVAAETQTATTRAFEPLLINASAGFFANPIEKKKLAVKLKAGAGSQHIIARDGYAVTGYAKDTATVTLKQLETSTQAGAEFELEANGEVNSHVSWKAKSRFFYPLYSSSEQKFTGVDALNTDVTATLSVKLAKWASLDYVFTLKRIPLVVDQWQMQHGLLLTTGFNLL
ncbi:MAG: hypothetical protein KC502_05605 [Myxococcales bacterium]|nr:hypothetical protein [Myxococcales bacterium]